MASVSVNADFRDRARAQMACTETLGRLRSAGGDGAILAIDVSEKGLFHAHGIALCRKPDQIAAAWAEVTRSSPKAVRVTTLTGWSDAVALPVTTTTDPELLGANIAKVVAYVLRSWPQRYGQRDLAADVFAVGSLEGPWRGALDAA